LRERVGRLDTTPGRDEGELAELRQRLATAQTPEQSARDLEPLHLLRRLHALQHDRDLLHDTELPHEGSGDDNDVTGDQALTARLRAVADRVPDDHELALQRRRDEADDPDEAARLHQELLEHRERREVRTPPQQPPAEEEQHGLRERVLALGDDHGPVAELRRRALEADTKKDGAREMKRLRDLRARLETDRQARIKSLSDALDNALDKRITRLPTVPGADRGPHLDQAAGDPEEPSGTQDRTRPDGREPAGRIAELRRELDKIRTLQERLAPVRDELTTPVSEVETPGHLERVTEAGLRSHRRDDAGDGPPDTSDDPGDPGDPGDLFTRLAGLSPRDDLAGPPRPGTSGHERTDGQPHDDSADGPGEPRSSDDARPGVKEPAAEPAREDALFAAYEARIANLASTDDGTSGPTPESEDAAPVAEDAADEASPPGLSLLSRLPDTPVEDPGRARTDTTSPSTGRPVSRPETGNENTHTDDTRLDTGQPVTPPGSGTEDPQPANRTDQHNPAARIGIDDHHANEDTVYDLLLGLNNRQKPDDQPPGEPPTPINPDLLRAARQDPGPSVTHRSRHQHPGPSVTQRSRHQHPAPPGSKQEPGTPASQPGDSRPAPAADRPAQQAAEEQEAQEQEAKEQKAKEQKAIEAVARSLVTVPEGVEAPDSAREEAVRQLVRALGGQHTAFQVWNSGVRVVVIPRGTPVTDLPGLGGLRDVHDGDGGTRSASGLRGVTDLRARVVAIAEENLLGETTEVGDVPHYPDGYSSVTHELAHLVYAYALTDAERASVFRAYVRRWAQGPDVEWADGPRRDTEGSPADNYASLDEAEYFAQTVNAYLGTNHGRDEYTGRTRNNGSAWVRTHELDLAPLLERLYGSEPDRAAPSNPVHAVRTETLAAVGRLSESEEPTEEPTDVQSGEPSGGDGHQPARAGKDGEKDSTWEGESEGEAPWLDHGGAQAVPIEEVLAVPPVVAGVSSIWLPDSLSESFEGDEVTVAALNVLAGPDRVFIFGTVLGQGLAFRARWVSPAALASLVGQVAADRTPVLAMRHGDVVAPLLAAELGRPVYATRYGVEVDAGAGTLRAVAPPPGEKEQDAEGFREYDTEHPEGIRRFDELPGPSRTAGQLGSLETQPGEAPADSAVPVDVPDQGLPLGGLPEVHPMARSVGVPRAGLPYVSELITAVKGKLRDLAVDVPPIVWERLPQRLLSNYRYVVASEGKRSVTGLQVNLGSAEVLFTLDPSKPHFVHDPAGSYDHPAGSYARPTGPGTTARAARPTAQEPIPAHAGGTVDDVPAAGVREPSRFRATEIVNASYHTGTFIQQHSGSTSGTHAAASLSYGVGLLPGALHVLRGGVSLSGAANASWRSTNRGVDAEGGHVQDDRTEAVMLSYTPNWSFRIRTDDTVSWQDAPSVRLMEHDPGDQTLLLWLSSHNLERPGSQVQARARDIGDEAKRLPVFHFASGMTGLTTLFDSIVEKLRDEGVRLPIGSVPRNELLQKLSNLDAHLDEAVNTEDGYSFALHDKRGRTIATVGVHTTRTSSVKRVGATSKSAHVENVRTAIDLTGGSHTLTQSTGFTPLFVELDALPSPVKDPSIGVGASIQARMDWVSSDTLSAGRAGLWVLVSRYVGFTGGYDVGLAHRATVNTAGHAPVDTALVTGRALLRMPEPEAYKHGFPVDRAALEVADGETRLRGTLDREAEQPPLPRHIALGKGVGMGLVRVSDDTVRQLRSWLDHELRQRGFLPSETDGGLTERNWRSHGNRYESQLSNLDLVRKLVSSRGLESHYDQIHQGGMTFTLHRRRGAVGIDFDVDAARVTITAVARNHAEPDFQGASEEYHVTNLAMGMESAGISSSGSRQLGVGLRVKTLAKYLRGSTLGLDLTRSVGATEGVSYLNNRPELLEYAGKTYVYELTSDYQVTVEFQHSGVQGRVRPGTRDSFSPVFDGQRATAHLLPIGADHFTDLHTEEHTPRRVLDNAAVYFVDASGLRQAAEEALDDLVGPQGGADQELSAFTGTLAVRSHFKEIASGRYTTDQFFDSGLLRDTFGAVDIASKMGRSVFKGATQDPFVLGVIKLWLTTASTTDSTSHAVGVAQFDTTVGGTLSAEGPGYLQGGVSGARRWQYNRSVSEGRAGGKELIQLAFDRAYAFEVPVDFTVRARSEKHGKFRASDHRDTGGSGRSVSGRTMVYLLPEPEALYQYVAGTVPIPDEQLTDVLTRWAKEELRLPGTIVAGVLIRAYGPGEKGSRPQEDARAAGWPVLLAERHKNGASPVLDADVRTRFNALFARNPDESLDDPVERIPRLSLPEYLRPDNPGGTMLGHSGIQSLTYTTEGDTTYDIVAREVEAVAPGLLASDPVLWTGDGRRIGRLQGAVNALQGLLAEGRDHAMWEDLLSPNGVTLLLVNPVGWLLTDVVRIQLSDVLLTSPPPRALDQVANTGLETYTHGYVNHSVTTGRDAGQSFTPVRFGGGQEGSGTGTLSFAEGRHTSVTAAESGVTEQTAYDWTGHQLVELPHRLTVVVDRLNMAGRPGNNALVKRYRNADPVRAAGRTSTAEGSLVVQLPRGLAEHREAMGPHSPRVLLTLPELGGDVFVGGALFDRALPVGLALLSEVFGREADGATTHTSATPHTLLSRTLLGPHLLAATAGPRHLLTDNLFVPGHSSDRARLYLSGDLYDLHVLGPVENTGTGRYAKHQSGTTVSTANDLWRGSVTASGDLGGAVHAHRPPASPDAPAWADDSLDGSTGQGRTTAADLSASSTENYRREQHVKQQGPVYLVRLRGKYFLEAEKFHRNLLKGGVSERGRFVSDPITGDVYVEMFQAAVDTLRSRLAERVPVEVVDPSGWQHLAKARPVDVTTSLVSLASVARDVGTASEQPYAAMAAHLRTTRPGRGPQALVLRLEHAALRGRIHRETVSWAVPLVKAAIETALTVDGEVLAAADAELERLRSAARRPFSEDGVVDPLAESEAIVRKVNELRDQLAPDRVLPPAELPTLLRYADISGVYLARDIAHELHAHVRLDEVGPDGTVRSHWAGPSGRVYAFDPLTFDESTLTTELAERAGALSPATRAEADLYGLAQPDLSRVYRTSWNAGRTFEEGVGAEVRDRRAALDGLDGRLPGLLERAYRLAGAASTGDEQHGDAVQRVLGELRDAAVGRDTSARDALFDRALAVLDRSVLDRDEGAGAHVGPAVDDAPVRAADDTRAGLGGPQVPHVLSEASDAGPVGPEPAGAQLSMADRVFTELTSQPADRPPSAGSIGSSDTALDAALAPGGALDAVLAAEKAQAGPVDIPAQAPPADGSAEAVCAGHPSDPARPAEVAPGSAKTQASPRAPWYTRHGMLGEATVRHADAWDADKAREAADLITSGLADRALAGQLQQPLADMLAENEPGRWDELLTFGRMVPLGDRLVWLRPVLADLQPAPAAPVEAVRSYTVRFNGTSAAANQTQESKKVADELLFAVLNLGSAAASTFVLGVPQVFGESATKISDGVKRNIISGRKAFVDSTVPFDAALRVRIFDDGTELSAGSLERVERGLVVEIPSAYATPDEPRPADDTDVTEVTGPADGFRGTVGVPSTFTGVGGATTRTQRPRLAGEVLNALDMTPVLAAIQHRLREQGLGPKTASAVAAEAAKLVNEESVRLRSRWLLTSGDVSYPISVGIVLPGLDGFRGHFRIRAALSGLQLIGVSLVKVREDIGGGTAQVRGRGGHSAVTYNLLANVTGLVDPGVPQPDTGAVTGMAPLWNAGFTLSRGWDTTTIAQSLSHTIINSDEPQARYRASFDVTVEFESPTHPMGPIHATAVGDLGVQGLGVGLKVFFPFEIEATRQVVENNHIQISCVR
ncbi:hypothetical protein ACWDBO_52660, partial [Streptomyces mirabilis]